MEPPLGTDEKETLLALARASIRERLGDAGLVDREVAAAALTSRLESPGASFVTLKLADASVACGERLRGCIGSITPIEPLYRDVIANAARSAFSDPRFPPLTAAEWPTLRIVVSVLTPLREIGAPEEIVIGRDGVELTVGPARAVFLPQVAAEQGWDLPTLLEQLALKAGLPREGWREGRLSVFRSESFGAG